MSDKVVFLAYRNTETLSDSVEVLACGNCRNKAWTAVYENDVTFPRLKCTNCGWDGGKFGWVHDETAPETKRE